MRHAYKTHEILGVQTVLYHGQELEAACLSNSSSMARAYNI